MAELTGGSSGYYKVDIKTPTTAGVEPYTAECNDIIEALGMDYAEGNAFKALWRKASARKGNGKPGNTALYDAEKVEFFGARLVAQEKAKQRPASSPSQTRPMNFADVVRRHLAERAEHSCGTCKHAARPRMMRPCTDCLHPRHEGLPHWTPKETNDFY